MTEREGQTRLNHPIRMFLLIWTSLLFSVRGNYADTGGQTHCQNGFCITLNQGEITAEAGLCVVIPCSFTVRSDFYLKNVVWLKCDKSTPRCHSRLDVILDSQNSKGVQSGFKGRVSFLEPDILQRNCSIIITDLTESDSGSYQLRVETHDRYKRIDDQWQLVPDGLTYSARATVSVKALTQKPTVTVPPLTEGQQTTLTCTAPGLCPGSEPKISWMWRGKGESDSGITGNITEVKTENLTAVTQRHSSTLTFDPSSEHHGTDVTCKVSFTDTSTTEETVTLSVSYIKNIEITGNANVTEGDTLNLTCSVESFPPSVITWTKSSDKNMQNATTSLQNYTQNDTGTILQGDRGVSTLAITNITAEDSGEYICTATHLNNTLMGRVNVTVMYMKPPVITGNATVEVGQSLNLTCGAESLPPARITWTKPGSDTNLRSEPGTDGQSDTGSATLVIHNVGTAHAGQYICTAEHMGTVRTVYADVLVTLFPKILHSACKIRSEVLTCTCISQAIPLPTVKWSMLKKHNEYSVFTTVSNNTVNTTLVFTVKNSSNISDYCVSSNENGKVKEKLTMQTDTTETQESSMQALKIVSWLEVTIAFLAGLLLSAVICCLAIKCHRRKQKRSGKLDENVELVTNQEDPLIDAGQAAKHDQTYYQEGVKEEEAEEAETVEADKAAVDFNSGPKDVEYASIDFSVLKKRSLRDAAKKRVSTETEYAEIKKQGKKHTEENGIGEGEVNSNEREDEIMSTKDCAAEEEDMAVYSTVKDAMDEV